MCRTHQGAATCNAKFIPLHSKKVIMSNIKNIKNLLVLVLSLAATAASAQQAPTTAPTAAAAQPWIYKTKQLNRAQIDALLAKPKSVLVIDVRRPDELISKGGFPVYLSIQIADLEKSLDLIPKDRAIITVSNRAHRAGAAGDILSGKGFNVAGAAGSLDYEEQGGAVTRIIPPPPRAATVVAGAAGVTK
jgi:rhodanese-related sulfurtransferase